MLDQEFERSLSRKLFMASMLSGAIKGAAVSFVVYLSLGSNSFSRYIQILAACVTLSILLDLLWFYRRSMFKHAQHKKRNNELYDQAVKDALKKQGAYKMVSSYWFVRDFDQILKDG